MRKESHLDQAEARNDSEVAVEALSARGTLPNRLMTAFEVAEFVGCHEESVRRAYLCGQLKRQRFGVRSWRFQPADVQDWIARGAPTRIS
jgi:excisionase family DNA binding protein